MSEPDVTLVDATPPPDVVERPARSSGAYKLCMECGQNVLRPHYRAGSSVCKRCEALADAQGYGPVPLVEGAATPEVEPHEGEPQDVLDPAVVRIEGSADALAWLRSACGGRAAEPLTLEAIAVTLGSLLEQRTQMIGRVTRQQSLHGELRPEDVPLETAAQTLYLACDPILQEALTAATELLGLSLNQVILGNLAFGRQELLNQDQSLVPDAPYAVQFGSGRGVLTQGGRGLTPLPGGRLIDSSGQLVKTCLCCGREFHPPRERPNPDFCDDYCGEFVDHLRRWATNRIGDEMAGREPSTTPLPDPRTFWQVERCQEPYLHHALQFREHRVAQQMEAARLQQEKMRGV